MTLQMDMNWPPSWAIFLACPVLVLWLRFRKRSQFPYPPGPKGLPFIGPALQFPRSEEWKAFRQWCRDYNSDIVCVNILGNSIVILDNYKTAVELLDRRSAKYSSRPTIPMQDLMRVTECSFASQPYGENWRKDRRLFTDIIRQQTISRFHPHINKATSRLLFRIMHDPISFDLHTINFGMDILFMSTYDAEVDVSYLNLWGKTMDEMIGVLSPGAHLVNIMPILKHVPGWVPGAGFQQLAARYGDLVRTNFVFGPHQAAKERLATGIMSQCFVSDALQDQNLSSLSPEIDHRVATVAFSILGAGTETTSSSIRSFLLAMVLYPEIQKTCFDELRRVCGPDRLPSYELDRESLPYFTATLMESFRWAPAVPLGLPHSTTEDDVYNGQYIPSGSTIIANVWSMGRDESVYPEPEIFKPERFLRDGAIDSTVLDPYDFIFGFGRRICPGRHLARVTTWTSTASILATLELSKIPGEHVGPDFESAITVHPKPFKCNIKPRDGSAAELIELTAQKYS